MNIRKILPGLFLGLLAMASSVQAATFSIDSRTSFLRASNESPPAAFAFSLATLGLTAGDTIQLTQLGDFDCSGGGCGDNSVGMIGVFSSSATLLSSALVARVAGAIDAGVDIVTSTTFFNGLATDIAQDFAIAGGAGTLINIPNGAAYLFIAAHDSYFADNVDPDNDFAVSIQKVAAPVPEPETYAMMLAGLGLLGFTVRRRRQKVLLDAKALPIA